MRIEHSKAIALESVLRSEFQCDRAGMGGYIDADHFESNPFDAALIAIAPLWKRGDAKEIESFLTKWEYALREERADSHSVDDYIDELSNLISRLENSRD